ncbi:hypothetical protein [Halomonas sp. PGE1]|uniref:hypothetical protein n=1 Tax=Halomonas sp. PGE1 TaxID=2730360 RepID=UPI0014747198|nr:hypothetical protein [Halomonas sp. PGE1]QJQ98911.1 hypothetical protein HIR79_09545 [Halomonas sp. PGE1]
MMTEEQIEKKVDIHWRGKVDNDILPKIVEVWLYLQSNLADLSRDSELEGSVEWWFQHIMRGPIINIAGHDVDLTEQLIEESANDAAAFEAAKKVSASMIENGQQLTPALAGFVVTVLRDNPERPKSGHGTRSLTDLRNERLAFAVWMLRRAGVSPTRKVGSEDVSGCDIVADVFYYIVASDDKGLIRQPKGGSFSEKTMYDIWVKNSRVKAQKTTMGVYLDL